MAENNFPKVKVLRKEILIGGLFILVLLIGFIVFNLLTPPKKNTNDANKIKIALSSATTPWYANRTIAVADTNTTSVQNSSSASTQPLNTNNSGVANVQQTTQAAPKQVSIEDLQKMQQMQMKMQQQQERQKLLQQQQEERNSAMKVSIGSNELKGGANGLAKSSILGDAINPAANNNGGWPVSASAGGGIDANNDSNMVAEKRAFMTTNSNLSSNVLSSTVNKPVAPYVLSKGTKIPAILDQQVNTDLPGQIYGHVSRDVFDSRTHSNILIPAGSNLVGIYDSSVAYGQTRVLVAWTRINFPNGLWLDLQGMGGASPDGAGLKDLVDNHFWSIIGASFVTSVLAAGAQLAQPPQSNVFQGQGVGQTIAQSVGNQIASTGTTIINRSINLQPTLIIRPGFEFDVEVNKDIIFPDPYTGNANKL